MIDYVKQALIDQHAAELRERMTYWADRLNHAPTREQRVHAGKKLSELSEAYDKLMEA